MASWPHDRNPDTQQQAPQIPTVMLSSRHCVKLAMIALADPQLDIHPVIRDSNAPVDMPGHTHTQTTAPLCLTRTNSELKLLRGISYAKAYAHVAPHAPQSMYL